MTWALAKEPTAKALRRLWLLAACCLLVLVPVPAQRALAAAHAADDFNRANGSLGQNWTSIRDGGLSISSHAVTGHNGLAGDIWTAGRFVSDQYSQIEVSSKRLRAGQWIGATVRVRNGGRDAYAGLYFSNGRQPELQLFKRSEGSWIQLGTYRSGPLPAGTKLKLVAVGSTIVFLENDLLRLWASDRSISDGAPGIMIYGVGAVGTWSGGNVSGAAGFQVYPSGIDAQGVRSYQVFSAANGPGPQVMRVLAPTHPARGIPHNFLYVLPVQPGLSKAFNDGLDTLRRLDAQDQYNLTIIEPTFGIDPWYANNPKNGNVQYETFMTREVVPWAEKNLAITGREQNWLLGFSKSGLAGQDLILKHPGIFALAASWDFPANMSSYDQLGADPAASYGTDANFQVNYRLTAAFLNEHKEPFVRQRRIWIGGNRSFPADMSYYATLLTKEHILYAREARSMGHQWDSGWVPIALTALRRDSIKFRPADINTPPAGRAPSQSYPMSIRWLYK
jgi:hypothetical protein